MANLNFNKAIIGGRLTADPELKTTPSGVSVTSFIVAVNRRFGEKQADGTTKTVADFITVQAWRQTAEFVCRFFRKASSICIVGSIQTRSWTDQQGQKHYATEVVADEAYFVDAKGEAVPAPGGSQYQPQTQAAQVPQTPGGGYAQPAPSSQFEELADDEELPF